MPNTYGSHEFIPGQATRIHESDLLSRDGDSGSSHVNVAGVLQDAPRHSHVLLFRDEARAEALRTFGQLAHNERIDWFQAAYASQGIRQSAEQHPVPEGNPNARDAIVHIFQDESLADDGIHFEEATDGATGRKVSATTVLQPPILDAESMTTAS